GRSRPSLSRLSAGRIEVPRRKIPDRPYKIEGDSPPRNLARKAPRIPPRVLGKPIRTARDRRFLVSLELVVSGGHANLSFAVDPRYLLLRIRQAEGHHVITVVGRMRRSTHGDHYVLLAGHRRHVGDRRGTGTNRQAVLTREICILLIVGKDVVILEAGKKHEATRRGHRSRIGRHAR